MDAYLLSYLPCLCLKRFIAIVSVNMLRLRNMNDRNWSRARLHVSQIFKYLKNALARLFRSISVSWRISKSRLLYLIMSHLAILNLTRVRLVLTNIWWRSFVWSRRCSNFSNVKTLRGFDSSRFDRTKLPTKPFLGGCYSSSSLLTLAMGGQSKLAKSSTMPCNS